MVVVDASSGLIIAARELDRRWYPASLTKLLTLTAAFDALDSGSLSPHQSLTVSARAAAQPPTKLGLRAGESISVDDAIRAVAVISANDASVVLAEAIGGTEATFVGRLNALAHELGLTRTQLRNASGLPGPDQWTTARDMARLALALAARHPSRMAVFSQRTVTFRGRNRASHNRAQRLVGGGAGLKTGFTCDAGYNVVLRTHREESSRIAVVLGARSRYARDVYAQALITRPVSDPSNGPPLRSVWGAPSPSPAHPPRRLLGRACHPPTAWRPITRQTSIEGWGIFLGNYADRAKAAKAAGNTHTLLHAGLTGQGDWGRGAVGDLKRRLKAALLSRTVGAQPTWKLLMTGLTPREAGSACKELARHDRLCAAQSPARMAMTGYPNQ